MSAPAFIMRIVVFITALICVGTIGVFGFTVIEPFHAAFGEPPSGLGWGNPGSTTIIFTGVGIIGLILTLIIWFVAAPVRRDQRQEFRR